MTPIELKTKLIKILDKIKDKPFNKHYQDKFWSTFMAYEEVLKKETQNDIVNTLKDNIEFMCNSDLKNIKYL